MIELIKEDITKLDVDVIVNAANSSLLGGGGVDGAIHRAAGPKLFEECLKLGGCKTGDAKITKGYNLKAKYIIHTVGPIYSKSEKDPILLASCYTKSLDIALSKNLKSIAFPCISTGVYSYPIKEAAEVSFRAVKDWLSSHDSNMRVIFCCFSDESYNKYKRLLEEEK